MPKPEKVTAESILSVLSCQRFADWYGFDNSEFSDEEPPKDANRFDRYLTGELPKVTKEEILADIRKMFGVK